MKKKLSSLKRCVRSQVTRLKLQKSFYDLDHGVSLCSTYNSHHKVLVNLQASNIDAIQSKSCVQFSKICVFTFVARRCRSRLHFRTPLTQVVTVMIWSLVPLPCRNPACSSAISVSVFTRILSSMMRRSILLAWETRAIVL